ncbi:MAG: Nif3-like dinuclear metal center hexameric protein [Peptostreptococcaceae bacterium]
MKLKKLIKKIEEKYPLDLAYEWDNVGLLIGDYEFDVKKVLVTLEANEKVIDEAIDKSIDLIITHHPFIFKKMNKINTSDYKGKLIHKLIKNDVAIYSMHTNFDIAFGGLNDYFMEVMGFENVKILDNTKNEVLYKLVVYVPNTHVEKVKNTLSKAGCGHIGNYSHCSFSTDGLGNFKPLEGSNPFIGEEGKIEIVNETKIETIATQKVLGAAISSMINAHPYEEVAYDLYKLENKGEAFGLGRISKLDNSITLSQLCNQIKQKLNMNHLRIVGDLDSTINKVAVVTGSGADMVKKAQRQGAQVLITGDIKYHDAQDALDIGMNVIDCGHFETEDIFKDVIKRALQEIEEIEVQSSMINLNPFQII